MCRNDVVLGLVELIWQLDDNEGTLDNSFWCFSCCCRSLWLWALLWYSRRIATNWSATRLIDLFADWTIPVSGFKRFSRCVITLLRNCLHSVLHFPDLQHVLFVAWGFKDVVDTMHTESLNHKTSINKSKRPRRAIACLRSKIFIKDKHLSEELLDCLDWQNQDWRPWPMNLFK